MSGFGKVSLVGEYNGQKIVNVLHYRSVAWLPAQGNPFDDVLAFVDAVLTHLKAEFLACLPTGYKLNTAEGVGYGDDYSIVTASPLIRTVNEFGTLGNGDTNGAAACAILSMSCGEQVNINGVGKSKRNRGYLAIGPLLDGSVDNYSHINGGVFNALDGLGEHIDDTITVVAPAVSLIPIRIHERYLGVHPADVLVFRTYSDIRGYRINRVASYRRSRQPEA
jgi:hypothetical protein